MLTQKRNFNFQFWPTIGAIFFILLFCKLALWQYHRGNHKTELQQQYQTNPQLPSLPLEKISTTQIPNLIFRNISAQGHYDTAHQFLLDNQYQQEQIGYHVLTPFVTTQNKAVLVDRGWIPAKQALTIKKLDETSTTINGFFSLPEKNFILGQAIENSDWPIKIQRIDLIALAKLTHYNFISGVILLQANEPNGFVRDWQAPVLNPQMNYGYTFQWLALALTVLIVYLVLSFKKPK